MERQFLVKPFIIFILLTGCQQIEVVNADKVISDNKNIENIIPTEVGSSYLNIWQYLIINSIPKDELINEQVLFYMNVHIKDVEKFTEYLNDSYYFIYFVLTELEKANLPLEFALLPYIESNYDPFSISSSGAVGIWQFMPRTGKLYGLEKTWWNEDRHDPFQSTIAAVNYLKYLYERFDENIYLTLAAYNAGPSLLDRRINRNKRRGIDTDFWSLDLPNQTKNYVPKFIALKELVYNSDKYGITLPYIPNKAVVKKISIPGQVEILTLSEYIEIKPELIYKLNAGYTKWASAPEDESIFYIPYEKYELFKDDKNQFGQSNEINWISHTIKRGDNLWSLALKYDTEVKIIKEINYLNTNVLSIGSTLLIPLGKTESNKFIPYEIYIVSEGDTLWKLAKKFNLDVRDLAKMNSINENSYLYLGQQLTIGNKNIHRNIESKKRTILYSIKQGDNLYKISELFDVSIKSIKDINEMNDNVLMPGEIIKVEIKAF